MAQAMAVRERRRPARAGSAGQKRLYPKLPPGRKCVPPAAVAEVQGRRLRGAMIEAVARSGPRAVTGEQLCQLAGVSKRTLYEHFPGGVDACLSATCETIFAGITARVGQVAGWGADPRAQMRGAMRALTETVAQWPLAGRLVLVDAFGARTVPAAAIADGCECFEEILAASVAEDVRGAQTPALVLKGVVAGVAQVLRAHLIAGRERQLPECAEELACWALACCGIALPEEPAAPARRPANAMFGVAGAAGGGGRGDVRVYLLEACASLLAKRCWEDLGIDAIEKEATVRRGAFRAEFADPAECALELYRMRSGATLAHALAAAASGADRPAMAARAAFALSDRLAGEEGLAKLCFCDVLRIGAAGVRAQTELLERFAAALGGGAGSGSAPVALSAAAGAVWGVCGHLTARGRAAGLRENRRAMERLLAAGMAVPPARAGNRAGAGNRGAATAPGADKHNYVHPADKPPGQLLSIYAQVNERKSGPSAMPHSPVRIMLTGGSEANQKRFGT